MTRAHIDDLAFLCDRLSEAADAGDHCKAISVALDLRQQVGNVLADVLRDLQRLDNPIGKRRQHKHQSKGSTIGGHLARMERTLIKGLKLFPPSWRYGLSDEQIRARENASLAEHGLTRGELEEFTARLESRAKGAVHEAA